jgi:hypothetical protein
VSARLDATEKRLKILADRLAAEPGAWLSFVPDEGDGRLWLLAGDQAADCVTWQTAWWEGAGGDGNIPLARVARLALTLQTRTLIGPVSGDQKNDRGGVLTMPDLGFSAPHPRFWGYLPDDATLYEQRRGDPEPAAGLPGAGLWPEAMASRFPLAGPEDPDGVFLPLGLVLRSPRPQGVGSRAEGLDRPADAWPGPVPQVADALARDGLVPEGVNEPALTAADWAEFLAQVHLDSNLREVGQASLLAEAFDLRFVQGRRLTGLHSVLPLEEVSLLAMCDAAHRGWRLVAHTEPPEPPPPVPPPSPAPCPDHDLFHDCDDNTTPSGQRLRDTEAARGSDFSRSPAGWRWELLSELEYDPSGLLEIQRAAVEMAAARGDLVIILGLPAHYRTAEALSHRQALGRGLIGLRTTASYAALYHPWLWIRDEDNGAEPPSSSGGRPAGQATLRLTPPEGAACGIIAGRGLTRGAWIAPANQPVRDAIGLSFEPSADEATELYNATVNLISRGAHGFTVMGADTLSDDPDLAPLGVRRLLILLRRLALREGQTYVFAPHSPAFRRRVALGFERQLARMFARGAFAGDNPASAYRVVVDETVNTPEVVALGQFIVELRVAPSRPMTFIVVRLVQAEPQTFTVQEL